MKKQISIIGTSLLLIILSFSGCELLEEKEDYITVYIEATIGISLYDNQGKEISVWDKVASSVPVYIEMIKAGGERLTFDKTTNTYGWVAASGSFNLYKEQRIDVYAESRGGFEDFYQYNSGFATLSWEVVDDAADFGGDYVWSPQVIIQMRNSNMTY